MKNYFYFFIAVNLLFSSMAFMGEIGSLAPKTSKSQLPTLDNEATDDRDKTSEYPKGLPLLSSTDSEPMKKMPKLKIHFYQRLADGQLKPCGLPDICFQRFISKPVDVPSKYNGEIHTNYNLLYDPHKVESQKQSPGVRIGMIKESDYAGGFGMLLQGHEYKLSSNGCIGVAYLRIPDNLEPGGRYVFNWVVNEGDGEAKSKKTEPALIEIVGQITETFPNGKRPWQAVYYDSQEKQTFVVRIKPDRTFFLRVKNLGGSLAIVQTGDSPSLFYKKSVIGKDVVFPKDADFIFREEDQVECRFKISGKMATDNQITGLGLFIPGDDELVINGIELDTRSKPQEEPKNDMIIRSKFSPGEYIVKLFGPYKTSRAEVISTMKIKISPDSKLNDFEFKLAE